MDEEQIERIVESSKRMQEVSEFTSNTANDDLFDSLAETALNVAIAMREQTECSDIEIISSVVGSISAILVGWIIEYEDD
jgi:hypothetical protein